jgi:hypothetical protein
MDRCSTCRHFAPGKDAPGRDSLRSTYDLIGYGSCGRWQQGYGYDQTKLPRNEVLVENDEGWAMMMGPDFGCVLHEPLLQASETKA